MTGGLERALAMADPNDGLSATERQLQSLARAVMGQLGECPAYPGRPSQCDPEVCDCFMADNLVRLMDAVRADERAALAAAALDELGDCGFCGGERRVRLSSYEGWTACPRCWNTLLARAAAVTQEREDWKAACENASEQAVLLGEKAQAAEAECARLRHEVEQVHRLTIVDPTVSREQLEGRLRGILIAAAQQARPFHAPGGEEGT